MNTISKFLLLLVVALFPFLVSAGSFQVTPVHLTLAPNQTTVVMTVVAHCQEASTLQLEAVAWHQKDGKDIYEPTNDLLVTPPIFKLNSGETKTVRIGLHHAAPLNKEVAYRLYIREVPQSPRPGFKGVQVALRIGVPVFVEPSVKVKPELKWHARRLAHGEVKLEVENSGSAHIQLTDLRVAENKAGASKFIDGGALYVLPNQSRHWTIKPASLKEKKLQLLITSNHGKQKLELPIEEM